MVTSMLSQMASARVCVIGDLILDRYILGDAERISQEAPVPVVSVSQILETPGGAANVAANVASLGANCFLVGTIGSDDNGKILKSLLSSKNVNVDGLLEVEKPTTTKTRVVSGIQQIVRFDLEDTKDIKEKEKNKIFFYVEKLIRSGKVDAIILEDYAKGLLDADLVTDIIDQGRMNRIPIILDPNPKSKINPVGVTSMTPNKHEAYKMAGVEEGKSKILDIPELLSVGSILISKFKMLFIMITLGKDGMIIINKDLSYTHIPTKALEVFDVSGAGDTVIAAFTSLYCKSKNVVESAKVSNVAAGIVVGKRGASTVTVEEIVAYSKLVGL